MARSSNHARNATTGNLGFEATLWATADALRNNMDAAEHGSRLGCLDRQARRKPSTRSGEICLG